MKQKLEQGFLYAVALVVYVYVILRARILPITVDEVSTCINHVPRGVLDILTYKSDAVPNNHILNTLSIKGLTGLMGMHHFVVRIPVLIGAFLYLWSGIKISQRLSGFWFQTCAFLLLVGNPFLLEFFGLGRGYGLAIGMMMTAIRFTLDYVDTGRNSDVAKGLGFAFLAIAANFTLLNFFAPFVFLLGLLVYQKSEGRFWRVGWYFPTILVLTAAFCYLPVTRMRATDQFQFWHVNGFFLDTMAPLVKSSTRNFPYFGHKSVEWLAGLSILASVGAWITALVLFIRKKGRLDEQILISGIFGGTVTANLLNALLLHTPFLDARTSLFYYPLFALQLIVVAQWLYMRWGRKMYIYLAVMSIFATFNTAKNANLSHSYEWWFDGGTFKMLDYIKDTYEREKPGKPYTLDSKWVIMNTLMFHTQYSTPHWEKYVSLVDWHGPREFKRDTDFYFTDERSEIEALNGDYQVVFGVPLCSLVLMRKKSTIPLNQ